MSAAKLALARAFDLAGLNSVLLRIQQVWFGPHIRIVNYHDVPRACAAGFEAQVRYLADRFSPVGLDDLVAAGRGEWKSDRPGIVLSFDDGLRSHFDVAAPILEKYGFIGYFLVPVEFVDRDPSEQIAFARDHQIGVRSAYPDGRVALSWEEVRTLSSRHVVGCHTWNHTRLSSALGPRELETEISLAKRRLERETGREIRLFGWVGGEEWSYSAAAAEEVRRAGFQVAFMTNNAVVRPGSNLLQLQRTNVEADFPLELFRFQLSGFLDLMYARKRARVNRITAG